MHNNTVSERSPLRILDGSIQKAQAGDLGVVMARAGVGKTAFLVQVGIDHALRGETVLHLALGQTLEHVRAWYDELFDDLASASGMAEREESRNTLHSNRVIQTFADTELSAKRLEEAARLYQVSLGFEPALIIVDGFDWSQAPDLGCLIDNIKTGAKKLGAKLWMSAQTHRDEIPARPTDVTAPCKEVAEQIDIAVFLEPREHIGIRLLKDHDADHPRDTELVLDPDTMRLLKDGDAPSTAHLPASAFTLLSGGAPGSEAAFGEMAEKYGMTEVCFSFAGRTPERTRGLVELADEDLQQGAVSSLYVESQLHRTFPSDDAFQKVLQTIWHQVTTAGEVFVIGVIQQDDTVRGGTGWAAELARRFEKPLYVFDQGRNGWFAWNGTRWVDIAAPKVRRTRFCGTGTIRINEAGRKAIAQLFADSFAKKG